MEELDSRGHSDASDSRFHCNRCERPKQWADILSDGAVRGTAGTAHFSSAADSQTGDGCGERDGRIALCGSPLGTGNCDSDFDRGRAGRRNSANGVGI